MSHVILVSFVFSRWRPLLLQFLVGLFEVLVHGGNLIDESQQRHVHFLRDEMDVDAEVDQAGSVSLQLSPSHVQRNYVLLVLANVDVGDFLEVNLE